MQQRLCESCSPFVLIEIAKCGRAGATALPCRIYGGLPGGSRQVGRRGDEADSAAQRRIFRAQSDTANTHEHPKCRTGDLCTGHNYLVDTGPHRHDLRLSTSAARTCFRSTSVADESSAHVVLRIAAHHRVQTELDCELPCYCSSQLMLMKLAPEEHHVLNTA